MSNNQQLAFSIIEFLNSERQSNSLTDDSLESLEVVVECLERVYNVSLSSEADTSKFHIKESLKNIFEKAVKHRVPTDQDKIEAERLKIEGNELMKKEKFTEAMDCYNEATEYDWTNAVYPCNRAAAHSKLGEHNEAIQDCEKALKLDNTYGKAYGRMGVAYMALERFAEAKDSYTKAVALEPNNEIYKSNLKAAEDKLAESANRSSSQPAGIPGGPNLLNSLFNNPAVMNMAQQFMSNPQMQHMMSNMMQGGMGGMGGMQEPNNEPSSQSNTSSGASESENNTENNTPAAGGMGNMFQFASQMAEQLRQDNPDFANNLRSTMQGFSQTDEGPNNPKDEEKK